MSATIFHSIWTILVMIIFLGIVYWAFVSRRRDSFDDAARMPLEDDKIDSHKENHHA